jgi:hypothetical protein
MVRLSLRPLASARLACPRAALILCAASAAACDGNTEVQNPPSDMSAAPTPDMARPDVCGPLRLPARPFETGTTGVQRGDLAGDFTVTDQNGPFTLSAAWSGCESYIFIPDGQVVSVNDSTPIWSMDLDALVAASPPNVHYFFVSRKTTDTAAQTSLDLVASQLETAIASLADGADATVPNSKAWWRQHLHFVKGTARNLGGWLAAPLAAPSSMVGVGLGIDRFQRVRGLGSFSDVNRFDGSIDSSKFWPFGNNLAYAANPPIYFNYEADRQAALDAEKGVKVVTVYDHEIVVATDPDGGVPDGGAGKVPGTVDKDVAFPDAATMKTFDTLEVDLTMNCPDKTIAEEQNNCGAWDYIVNINFLGDDGQTWTEMARFISSYHRAGRYLVDASQFLPYLAKGGVHHMRYSWAPPWNEQPAETVMQFRLSNSGKGLHPTQSIYLFSGGAFDATYDTRVPVMVDIPAGAKKVELRAIISGHGETKAGNCSEFCNDTQEFTVGTKVLTKDFPEVGDQQGCMAKVNLGAVPNQSGTWWLGRNGWCPGMQVEPWVVDVTDAAPAGQTVPVKYRALYHGRPPTADTGSIVLSSWLVIWE